MKPSDLFKKLANLPEPARAMVNENFICECWPKGKCRFPKGMTGYIEIGKYFSAFVPDDIGYPILEMDKKSNLMFLAIPCLNHYPTVDHGG